MYSSKNSKEDSMCTSISSLWLQVEYQLLLVIATVIIRWVRVGFRKISYKTDVKCKCRECKDIKSFKECVHTHPCPNKHNLYSYCFWRKLKTPYGYGYDEPPKKHDDTTPKPSPKPTKTKR